MRKAYSRENVSCDLTEQISQQSVWDALRKRDIPEVRTILCKVKLSRKFWLEKNKKTFKGQDEAGTYESRVQKAFYILIRSLGFILRETRNHEL